MSTKGVKSLRAPQGLCLYDKDFELETVLYFDLCEVNAFSKDPQPIQLDLRDVQFISAAAMISLLAMVTKVRFCSALGPIKSLDILFPKDRRIKGAMSKMGLLHLLTCTTEAQLNDSFLLKSNFLTGNNPEIDGERLVSTICKKNSLKRLPNKLSAAICEGLLNIHHHAYNEPAHDFLRGRWWACYELNKSRGHHILNCIILDKGNGITSKLRKAYPLRMDLLQSGPEAIKFAMEADITSTNIKGRGQGSEDMKHPVTFMADDDYFAVYSDNGKYSFDGKKERLVDLAYSVDGTLIEWCLKSYD